MSRVRASRPVALGMVVLLGAAALVGCSSGGSEDAETTTTTTPASSTTATEPAPSEPADTTTTSAAGGSADAPGEVETVDTEPSAVDPPSDLHPPTATARTSDTTATRVVARVTPGPCRAPQTGSLTSAAGRAPES